jgi:hypothetical protein
MSFGVSLSAIILVSLSTSRAWSPSMYKNRGDHHGHLAATRGSFPPVGTPLELNSDRLDRPIIYVPSQPWSPRARSEIDRAEYILNDRFERCRPKWNTVAHRCLPKS